jgi:hypothetical protein
LKFFFDNNLPPQLASAIHELIKPDRHSAIHLRQRFPPNISDRNWIEALGLEGDWAVISADVRIWKNPHEKEAWKASRLTVFFLTQPWSKQKLWEKAWRLIRWWPRIVEMAEIVEAGAAYEIPPKYGSGKLRPLRG